MKGGETESDELRATQTKWGRKYVALREVAERAIKLESETETKDMRWTEENPAKWKP